jgi:hypothetical protein
MIDLLMQRIESRFFGSSLTVQSGFRSVLKVLEHDKTLRDLIPALTSSPAACQQVYGRILTLLSDNPDPDHRQPHDEALTGYLSALNEADTTLTQQAVESVPAIPNLWWAKRLAEHLKMALPLRLCFSVPLRYAFPFSLCPFPCSLPLTRNSELGTRNYFSGGTSQIFAGEAPASSSSKHAVPEASGSVRVQSRSSQSRLCTSASSAC